MGYSETALLRITELVQKICQSIFNAKNNN